MKRNRNLWKDEGFEVEGLWLPSFARTDKANPKKDYSRYGKLSYSPEKGAFLKLFHDNDGVGWGSNLIYCRVQQGAMDNKVTCLGVNNHSFDGNSTTFQINSVFSGFFLPDPKEKNILEIEFSIKHLNNWIDSSGFRIKRNFRKSTFKIDYKGNAGRWLKLSNLFDYKISKDACAPHKVEDHGEVNTREYVTFHLRSRNGTPLRYDDFICQMEPILDFFTLASLDCVNPYNIYVKGDFDHIDGLKGEKISSGARLYLSGLSFSAQWFEQKEYNYLFQETDLNESLRAYLRTWIDKYELLHTPFSLYKSAVYNENYIDTKFILLCQSLESYHRRLCDGTYIPKDEFDEHVYQPLKQVIPDNIGRDFRQSLKNRLKYANEHSLRKRIKYLIDRYEDILKNYIKIPDDLSSKITETRNNLTHYPDDADIPTPDILQFYSSILKALLELCFLCELNFENEKIRELARRCERFRSIEYSAPWKLRYEK